MDETTNVIVAQPSKISENETIATPEFICGCEEWMRSACAGLPFYKEHEGKRYCVLHYPTKEKIADFTLAFDKKTAAQDFNFRGVWFPKVVSFSKVEFKSPPSFSYATFSEAVDFIRVTFRKNVDFSSATFKGKLSFTGNANNTMFLDEALLDLQHAEIEKPDHVSFHTVTLRPLWFINVDPRKFEFVNVTWITDDIDSEIKSLKAKNIEHPHRLLSIACRHLAVNAEEYHRYEDGMRFRYWAMDAKRRERFKGFAFWSISWWYWAASGYGERVFRAFIALIGIWLLFALLYTQVGFVQWEPRVTNASEAAVAERDAVGHPLPLSRAFTYSLAVMSLQKPEPKPATTTAHTLVVLQTILGPLQAALLALAIRRRFMR